MGNSNNGSGAGLKDGKNPAKSLNATINLEQMLNGAKSSRVLLHGATAANASGQRGSIHAHDSGSQRGATSAAADVDPVQISSLLN